MLSFWRRTLVTSSKNRSLLRQNASSDENPSCFWKRHLNRLQASCIAPETRVKIARSDVYPQFLGDKSSLEEKKKKKAYPQNSSKLSLPLQLRRLLQFVWSAQLQPGLRGSSLFHRVAFTYCSKIWQLHLQMRANKLILHKKNNNNTAIPVYNSIRM